MSLDPILFSDPQFETANEAVLFCYEKVRESAIKTEANRLRAFLPMNSADLARVVQRELVSIRDAAREHKEEHVLDAVRVAIDAVRWALAQPQYLAAS
jgi:hypothetical protein